MSHSADKHTNRKLHGALLIIMLLLFAAVFNRRMIMGYLDPQPVVVAHTPNMQRAANAWNQSHADSCLYLVRDGDLVLRSGSDAISALFRRVNTRDKSYSHAGIVFIENGCPMVYNCIGSADDPNAPLRRDSLISYIGPYDNTGYAVFRYNLRHAQVTKLHDIAVRYFKEGRAFDPYFDLATDSTLYCTEFVYKVIVETTGDRKYLPLTQTANFSFVAVDNLYARRDMKLVCKIGYMQ